MLVSEKSARPVTFRTMAQPQPIAASVPASPAARPVGFTGTDALLGLMVTLWGINFIVMKAVLPAFNSPLGFNAARYTLATIGIAGVALASGAKRPPAVYLWRLLLMGLAGNTAYQLLFIEGLAHTRAGNAALIMAAVPVEMAILSHFLGHERLRARDVAGLVLATAGISTIILGSGTAVGLGGSVGGDLLTFLSTLMWSWYAIGTKPLTDALGPIATTAWTMALGGLPLVLIGIPSVLAQDWHATTPTVWAGVVYSSLGSLVLAYIIWNRGISRLGPSRTAIFSNFTPVVAILAAWPLLGEIPTLWQILGAAGIFGGIVLTRT